MQQLRVCTLLVKEPSSVAWSFRGRPGAKPVFSRGPAGQSLLALGTRGHGGGGERKEACSPEASVAVGHQSPHSLHHGPVSPSP